MSSVAHYWKTGTAGRGRSSEQPKIRNYSPEEQGPSTVPAGRRREVQGQGASVKAFQ